MSKIKWLIEPNYLWMTLMQGLLPVWVYLAWGSDWYWWSIAFVFYFLYLCIGNNIGMHRYYSHRYFEMSTPMEYFVTWCAYMACLGSPLSYVNIHNIHHKLHDTDMDPHGPVRGKKSLLFWFHRHLLPSDMIFTRNLLKLTARRYRLLHDYYWLWVFGTAGLFYATGGWQVLLFCWLLPASATLWAIAFVLLMQHDQHGPNNSRAYMWFVFGETWHKNHHDAAKLADHSLGQGRDWTYELCKLLSKSNK